MPLSVHEVLDKHGIHAFHVFQVHPTTLSRTAFDRLPFPYCMKYFTNRVGVMYQVFHKPHKPPCRY